MSLCIGGVCVPYTAVVPLVILALKWVAVRMAQMGLLPKAIGDALHVPTSDEKEAEPIKAVGPSVVIQLEKEEELKKLLEDPNQKVVCKFTARCVEIQRTTSSWQYHMNLSDRPLFCFSRSRSRSSWCKPCHKVQPFYEKLSSHYADDAKFFTVDVDDFDEIAGKYNVAMMPTFLVIQGDKLLGRYSGSNENELQKFLKEQVGRSD